MPKISILVPCFNVERYVAECLQSLQQQTLDDFEVICLNDGSTDNTLNIIRQTVGNDNRFHIIDKPNSGYGATMNLGLTLAKGDYIGIVESDDFVEPHMFQALYEQAITYDLDISRCRYNSLTNGRVIPMSCPYLPKNLTFDPKNNVDVFHNPPSIWVGLYRRSLITNNDIHFLETPGAAYQDISFAFKTTLASSKIRCLPDHLLNYRIHQNNSIKKSTNVFVVFDEINECISFANKLGFEKIIKDVILKKEYDIFKWNFLRLPKESAHTFFKSWVKRWKENKDFYITPPPKNLKLLVYFLVITNIPSIFEKYLSRKSNK